MKYRLIIDSDAEEEVVATVHAPSELTERIEELVASYSGTDSIYAYNEDERMRILFSDIECITVIDRRVTVIAKNGGKYRTGYRLFELEELLPSYFIRINKSAIANRRRIARFKTAFSGAVDAEFKCGYTEYVSRRCFADIKRRLEK